MTVINGIYFSDEEYSFDDIAAILRRKGKLEQPMENAQYEPSEYIK